MEPGHIYLRSGLVGLDPPRSVFGEYVPDGPSYRWFYHNHSELKGVCKCPKQK